MIETFGIRPPVGLPRPNMHRTIRSFYRFAEIVRIRRESLIYDNLLHSGPALKIIIRKYRLMETQNPPLVSDPTAAPAEVAHATIRRRQLAVTVEHGIG